MAKNMEDLKITLVQADQVWEDKQANFALYETLLSPIEDTELILLPEMFQTGFSMNTELSEDFSSSESLAWLKKMAASKKVAFYTSLMIRDQEQTTNRGVFVFPDGKVEYYDKRKTFTLAKENEHFAAGKEAKIVHYLGWKIQLQVCYDLRFPEIMRNTWDKENSSAAYDLLLIVANWPAKRSEHWRALLKARAIENQCFVAAVNRVGTDAKGHDYQGDSCVIDALGGMKIDYFVEQKCTTIVIKEHDLKENRKNLPFLQDQ